MEKIIFIDVDGTLCMPNGKVPNSASEAIKKARLSGHKVFLCTGRSKPELTEDILQIGFDGIIGAGGGYIEVQNNIIMHKRMPEAAVKEVINYFNQYEIGYYIESNDGLFGSDNCLETIVRQVTKGMEHQEEYDKAKSEFDWFEEILIESNKKVLDYSNVNKISFISNGHKYENVAKKFEELFQMHRTTVPQFGPESGEISIKGVDKQTAIEMILNHLKVDKKNTLAYGDGNNDLAMFAGVEYGVAMSNATPELKKIAKEITELAEQDGLANSFKRQQLI
ncbi:HAD family hydrolase [Vagococcus intermedius]|uniref:HAD family hydrolase n=1 Tax=Vagococcus intermedius TaxID=2991418 RepID=A0AAF0I6U3_9ENTE|nr:HAD family hydrolase [Vagococcus intermedius]WEG72929.1 HAD family hydrolase [Vagococcus intermedius]WEG75016.1 HAD family hydrolase [Vagococcus intermedius]